MSMKERQVVGAVVDAALAAGYRLSVSLERGYDIEGMLLGSVDREKILDEAFAGDEAHIFVHDAGELLDGNVLNSVGWIFIVLGNDEDVISDYTINLEALIPVAD